MVSYKLIQFPMESHAYNCSDPCLQKRIFEESWNDKKKKEFLTLFSEVWLNELKRKVWLVGSQFVDL